MFYLILMPRIFCLVIKSGVILFNSMISSISNINITATIIGSIIRFFKVATGVISLKLVMNILKRLMVDRLS